MKQIVQSPRSGKLELIEVPAPALAEGQVLVRNVFSVVSPGTEKMAMDFARKSLLAKGRSRPDLVKQVTRKLVQEGPLPTYRAVTNRLDAPQPLGYSCAGVVAAVGAGVTGFAPGDRVACAGAGYANHAELIAVPENLVALVPDGVPLDQAAFSTLGAIAMQGLRVSNPTLGEIAAVIGLGLIGQLATQLLRANGCRVLGVDLDPARMKHTLDQGAEWVANPGDDHEPWRNQATGGYGADLALVTAASDSSAPIQLAAELCRMKGRVTCVGATAMNLDRRTFYDKELDLHMSMSYGPGRYEHRYEEVGLDYPIAYVRWTENRNLQSFMHLIASGSVRPDRLDAPTLPFDDAPSVYERLAGGELGSLAVVFQYGEEPSRGRSLALGGASGATRKKDATGVAFLGAGNYAKGVLLPAVGSASNVSKVSLVTATGASARRTGEKFGFASCGTDPETVFADPNVDLVFITTRHDSHADLACRALRAGKAVWLEKPVGLSHDEVDEVMRSVEETGGFLTVGYNRRFSAHVRAIRDAMANRGPLAIRYTVAPGPPPGGTWHTDPKLGGGRVIGEVCHFIDTCAFLAGGPPRSVFARGLGRDPESDDSIVAMLAFDGGSTATIEYLAHASSELPKERFEVSSGGATAICDNFRQTRFHGAGAKNLRTLNQDKGQAAAVAEVVRRVRAGEASPFTPAELGAVSRAAFDLLESARTEQSVRIRT